MNLTTPDQIEFQENLIITPFWGSLLNNVKDFYLSVYVSESQKRAVLEVHLYGTIVHPFRNLYFSTLPEAETAREAIQKHLSQALKNNIKNE